jgi:hypothetical protein
MEETGVPGENYWSVASHWQTLSQSQKQDGCISNLTWNKIYMKFKLKSKAMEKLF